MVCCFQQGDILFEAHLQYSIRLEGNVPGAWGVLACVPHVGQQDDHNRPGRAVSWRFGCWGINPTRHAPALAMDRGAFDLAGPLLKEWYKGCIGGAYSEPLEPIGWFCEGHRLSVHVWSPPPATALIALKQLAKARQKRPHSLTPDHPLSPGGRCRRCHRPQMRWSYRGRRT